MGSGCRAYGHWLSGLRASGVGFNGIGFKGIGCRVEGVGLQGPYGCIQLASVTEKLTPFTIGAIT